MILTNEMIAPLKRTNVSKDAEKTKLRIKEDFSAAKNKQKTAIVELTGLKRTSVYRVFREGAVSAKIVISMAQILGVSPFYYTGETDEKGECTAALLHSFLVAKGFKDLAYRIAPDRKTRSPEPSVPEEQSKPAAASQGIGALFSSDFSNSPELNEAVAALTEEDAVQLLRALLIRERAGGNASRLADFVKRCLLM